MTLNDLKNHEFDFSIKNLDLFYMDSYVFQCNKCKYKVYISKYDKYNVIYFILDEYWNSDLKKIISCNEQIIKNLLE